MASNIATKNTRHMTSYCRHRANTNVSQPCKWSLKHYTRINNRKKKSKGGETGDLKRVHTYKMHPPPPTTDRYLSKTKNFVWRWQQQNRYTSKYKIEEEKQQGELREGGRKKTSEGRGGHGLIIHDLGNKHYGSSQNTNQASLYTRACSLLQVKF